MKRTKNDRPLLLFNVLKFAWGLCLNPNVNTVLSVDPDNSPELTAMLGSSIATSISKVPFDGPIAGVKVGRINGKFF